MATKRQSSAESTAAVKRRLQFSGDGASAAIGHVLEGDVDESLDQADPMESFDDEHERTPATAGPRKRQQQQQQDTMIREQDRFLPIANVSRIMKRVLPESGKVAKEAKECVQECVSEFISFITSEASERCLHEKRKTINGEDILWAMQTLGFDPYVEPLKVYLSKYRLSAKGERHGGATMGSSISQGFRSSILMMTESDSIGGPSGGDGDDDGAGVYEDVDLDRSGNQRQVRVAPDGQLIIEMRGDAGANVVSTSDSGATAISLPVLSGTASASGAQQFILTALDQSAISGSGVQQFALPAGAQLAFIPASGGAGTSGTNAQGIPVMFLDSASGSSVNQQFITMNAPGSSGLQILHVAPSSIIGGGTMAQEPDNEAAQIDTSASSESH